MPSSINIREIILFVTSLFLAFFLFIKGCNNQKQEDDLVKNISNYKDSVESYKLKINGNQVDVSFNQCLMLENQKQLQYIIAKNDTLLKIINKFKKISSTTIINQYTTIKADTISLAADSIPFNFKPFHVHRDSLYYHFIGTIGQKFFSIDSLVIPNKQSIVIGEKKLGFLRGTERRAEIINSNPLIHTMGIWTGEIDKKNKWYQTTAFKVSSGMIIGSVAYWKLTR